MIRTTSTSLEGCRVFISASIPDPVRWTGPFDALEITDAIVAVARAILGAGGQIVTAAHPTVAPLLWYTAGEFADQSEPRVIIYQSKVFRRVLPDATRQFAAADAAQVIMVDGSPDERTPDPLAAPRSLLAMRLKMLSDERPAAGIFIGGMTGVRDEFELFRRLVPRSPVFAIGRPGGEASTLISSAPAQLSERLRSQRVYPALARDIVRHIRPVSVQ